MSPNLSAIAVDFGFNDEERDRKLGGDIALAFWVLGAPASFLIGCLADQYDRTRLFACTMLLGEGACLATYWTSTYAQLYVCRAITGLSIGGSLPLIYSVLGDMFEAEERHAVSSYVGIGSGIGIALGQGIAGFLGPRFGWRTPFLVVSIPALLIAMAFRLIVKDPERGGMERAILDLRIQERLSEVETCVAGCGPVQGEEDVEMVVINHKQSNHLEDGSNDRTTPKIYIPHSQHAVCGRDQFQVIASLLSTPTLVLSLLQGAPGCVPWGIGMSHCLTALKSY
jgi:MFS family permease